MKFVHYDGKCTKCKSYVNDYTNYMVNVVRDNVKCHISYTCLACELISEENKIKVLNELKVYEKLIKM